MLISIAPVVKLITMRRLLETVFSSRLFVPRQLFFWLSISKEILSGSVAANQNYTTTNLVIEVV